MTSINLLLTPEKTRLLLAGLKLLPVNEQNKEVFVQLKKELEVSHVLFDRLIKNERIAQEKRVKARQTSVKSTLLNQIPPPPKTNNQRNK